MTGQMCWKGRSWRRKAGQRGALVGLGFEAGQLVRGHVIHTSKAGVNVGVLFYSSDVEIEFRHNSFEVYSSIVFIHRVVQPSPLSNSKKFSSFQKESLYPLVVTPISLNFPSPRQLLVYFSSLQLCLSYTYCINGIL